MIDGLFDCQRMSENTNRLVSICEHFWGYSEDREYIDDLASLEIHDGLKTLKDVQEKHNFNKLEEHEQLYLLYSYLKQTPQPRLFHFKIAQILSVADNNNKAAIYKLIHSQLLAVDNTNTAYDQFIFSGVSDTVGLISEHEHIKFFAKYCASGGTVSEVGDRLKPQVPSSLKDVFSESATVEFKFKKLHSLYRKYGLTDTKVTCVKLNNAKGILKSVFIEEHSTNTKLQSIHSALENEQTHGGFTSVLLDGAYLSYDYTNNLQFSVYIFDRDKNLILDLTTGNHPFLDDDIKEFDETVLFIDDSSIRFNLSHFWFDKVTRAHYLREQFGTGNDSVLLFNNNDYTNYHLNEMGFRTLTDSFCIGTRCTIKLKALAVSENSFAKYHHPMDTGAPWAIDILRLQQANENKHSHNRIYLKRADYSERNIKNGKCVEALFKKYNFEIVEAENFTPLQQKELFSGCTFIAGIHGAGLTNLIFMPKGSTVLELLPPLSATAAYAKSALALGYQYLLHICDDAGTGQVANSSDHIFTYVSGLNARTVSVQLDKLESILKTATQ